jgi:hypothetical protein
MLKIFKGTSDLSLKLENYLRDSVLVDIAAGETIDVGYYKPISDLYLELKQVTPVLNSLKVEVYTGSWTSLSVFDRTEGGNRSGFIRWSKLGNEKATTLHSEELYWYRISFDEDITGLDIKGINLVFADDADLKESYPDIFEYLPEDAESFIAYHQEARNYILTYLRNKGKTIRQKEKYKMIDQFDLHNFDEVRQAAKYLALANIFYNESDSLDDKWKQKADGFKAKYGEAIDLNFLSIDENDDGQQQNSESNAIQYIKVMRL